MKTVGFLDSLRALSDGFADIISFGEYSAHKTRQRVELTRTLKQALKADRDALAGDWMAIYKEVANAKGEPFVNVCCPLCNENIEVACGIGYCQECGAWITTRPGSPPSQ